MRISSEFLSEQFLASIDQSQVALSATEQQISSGKAFQNASDNPIAAAEAVTLQSTLSELGQYANNANLVQSRLSVEDTTLASVQSILTSVRTSVVQAGDSTLSSADRASIATTVNQQLQSLLQLANTQDGTGQYLFSGSVATSVPFVTDASGTVTYQGDDLTNNVQIGSNRTLANGDSGDAVFNLIKNGNGTFQVTPGATTPAVTNTGSGVIGATSVTNPASYANYAGDTLVVSFSVPAAAFTTAAGTTNTGTGQIAQPTSSPASGAGQSPTTITCTSPTTYTLTTNGSTSAPQSYTSGAPIVGGGWSTSISGAPQSGDTFTVTPAQTTYTVTDTSKTPATVLVSAAPYTSGQAIAVPGAGIAFNLTGSPANGDAFTVTASANQSLFATLQKIVATLNTPTSSPTSIAALQTTLNAGLSDIDQAINNVSSIRTGVGARLNAITSQTSVNSSTTLELTKSLSSVQDTDYAAAITTLSEQQTSLQAAEQSFASLKKLSIFNYL